MNETSVQAIQFFNEPAVQLNAGGYQAVIVPGLGANMVELSRPGDNLSFLRTPDTIEKLRQSGQRYGIPPLFPPTINAPNLPLPDNITGFQLLAPGAGWSASCKINVEQ